MKPLLLIVALLLTGCATVQKDMDMVVGATPDAIGAVTSAAIFGGEVGIVPAPENYLRESINREGRMAYGDAQRSLRDIITDILSPK